MGDTPSTVGIVGAGLIGRSWAMVFARAGWRVRLMDSEPSQRAAAPELIRAALEDQARHGLVADAAAASGRISMTESIESAVEGAAHVQECGPETVEAKLALFRAIDATAPADALIASSSSAIVASRFTEALPGRARCLVAHPVNPPHLVPVVELCGAPWTSPATLEKAHALYASLGQAPILVRREIEGFILNRLQGALLAEAFRLAGEGYVSPADLDTTIKDGLGLRWCFMGPFETIELNAPGGIPDYCARYTGFFKRVAAESPSPDVYDAPNTTRILDAWGQGLDAREHAEKTRWRDGRLAALVAHKRGQQ
ncbi:MAG: 3-hydroxyacyl-CoA dehydrogenase [Hyphomicrobiaceae bacterium]